MRIATISVLISALVLSTSLGCAMSQKKVEKQAKSGAVNCDTADGDIRVLRSEKAHVVEQIGEGVTAIFPAGLVLGILMGTEGEKIKVATGEYNKAIEKHIALIQSTCGVK